MNKCTFQTSKITNKIFLSSILIILSAIVPNGANAGFSSTPDADTYVTNGQVYATAIAPDDTVYIGGNFSAVGISASHGVLIDTITGQKVGTSPVIDGKIFTSISDGSGGWYIGGYFTQVGGYSHNRLAHINSDGTVDQNFNPDINGPVLALALSDTTLYVGGSFTTVGDDIRHRLVEINIAGVDIGKATSFDPNINCGESSSCEVKAFALSDTTLYVGGYFLTIGDDARNSLAEVNITGVDIGKATAFNPNVGGAVHALALSDTTLYIGGDFTMIGGMFVPGEGFIGYSTRNRLAEINITGPDIGKPTSFDPDINNQVNIIVLSDTTLYVGGYFTTIGDDTRNYLAEINTTVPNIGEATAFNPNFACDVDVSCEVYALALSDTTIYAGGNFITAGDDTRNRLAEINIAGIDMGKATLFNPSLDDAVGTLTLSGTTLYAGGEFTIINPSTRKNIASIDGVTGEITSFNPNLNYPVNALVLSEATIYAGGEFTVVGDDTRNYLAEINTTGPDIGKSTSFDPNINNRVLALALSDTTIYVGGEFTAVGDDTRNYLAEINTKGINIGKATSFDPNMDGRVLALVLSDTTIYAGGEFNAVGDDTRNYLAEINITGINIGKATSFDPNIDGQVSALALSDTTLYVGGSFNNVGDDTRNNLAGINTTGIDIGKATSFDPNISGGVSTLALSDITIYVGGSFSEIGGVYDPDLGEQVDYDTRNNLAGINTTGIDIGKATSFDPNISGGVFAIAFSNTALYVGGDFAMIGGTSDHPYFARFNPLDKILISNPVITGVIAPEKGAIPVSTVTETEEYTATVSWNGDPTTFESSTIYTATITLIPKTDYTLTGVIEDFFTVDGATTTNSADSGIVTAVFPITEATEIVRHTSGSSGSIPNLGINFLPQQNLSTTPATSNPTGEQSSLNLIRTLRQGMIGADVKTLQSYLNAHRYSLLTLDGIFGPKTKAVVIKFQLANDLVGDGIVGPLTRARLR